MTKKPVETTTEITPVETPIEAAPAKPLNDAEQRDLIILLKHHVDQIYQHERGRIEHLKHTEPDNDNPSAIAQHSRRQVESSDREIVRNTEIAASVYKQLVQAAVENIESKMQRYGGNPLPIDQAIWQKVRDYSKEF